MYKGIKVLAGNLAFVSRNEHHPFRNGTKIIAITFQLVKDEARDAHSVRKTMRQGRSISPSRLEDYHHWLAKHKCRYTRQPRLELSVH